MRILQFVHVKRLALCLSLLGLMALSSGCGGEGEAPSPQVAEENQKNDAEARKKAYGQAGVPVGKKASEAASKH